jgi:hypothetical protein
MGSTGAELRKSHLIERVVNDTFLIYRQYRYQSIEESIVNDDIDAFFCEPAVVIPLPTTLPVLLSSTVT